MKSKSVLMVVALVFTLGMHSAEARMIEPQRARDVLRSHLLNQEGKLKATFVASASVLAAEIGYKASEERLRDAKREFCASVFEIRGFMMGVSPILPALVSLYVSPASVEGWVVPILLDLQKLAYYCKTAEVATGDKAFLEAGVDPACDLMGELFGNLREY